MDPGADDVRRADEQRHGESRAARVRAQRGGTRDNRGARQADKAGSPGHDAAGFASPDKTAATSDLPDTENRSPSNRCARRDTAIGPGGLHSPQRAPASADVRR